MKTFQIIFVTVLFINITFSNAGSNLRTSFDPFRLLTNQFLSTVQPNKTALSFFLNLFNFSVSLDFKSTALKGLETYVGYIILFIIGILFIFVFTIFGCCFCCCRVCCGKCGATPSKKAPQNMKGRRIAYNVLLFIFTSLIFIGAIVAMASNSILVETLNPTPSDSGGNIFVQLDTGVSNLLSYINTLGQNLITNGGQVISTTLTQAPIKLADMINLFITTFRSTLNIDQFNSSLYSLVSAYNALSPIAASISNLSTQHKAKATELGNYLANATNSLNNTLFQNDICVNITECTSVLQQLPNLVLGFNMSNINYTNDQNVNNVTSSTNASNFINYMSQINDQLSNISLTVNSTINNYITEFINKIGNRSFVPELNQTINKNLQDLTKLVNTGIQSFYSMKVLEKSVKEKSYDFINYFSYGWYFLLSIILLVILLFFIGICFGICGSPNDGNASCCSKVRGGQFFMGAIAISYIFAWLIMIITMVMFLAGGFVYTEFCTYLNTTDGEKLDLIDNFVKPGKFYALPSFGSVTLPEINLYRSVMSNCPNSTDMISAFNISEAFIRNVSSVIYNQYISGYVNETINAMNNITISPINTTNLEGELANVEKTILVLNGAVTSTSINELQAKVVVANIATFMDNVKALTVALTKNNKSDAAASIDSAVANLTSYVSNVDDLRQKYLNSKLDLKKAIPSLETSLSSLRTNLGTLKNNPNDARNKAISASKDKLISTVNETVFTTLRDLIKALGDCKGLSNLVNTVYNVLCIITLGPFNNLWMGVGWYFLFIIPAIIFAVKLISLYKISYIESDSAAYNQAYMSSNQFITKSDLEMIKLRRPQKA